MSMLDSIVLKATGNRIKVEKERLPFSKEVMTQIACGRRFKIYKDIPHNTFYAVKEI